MHLIAPGGVGGAESVVVAGAAALSGGGARVRVGVIREGRAPERSATFVDALAERGVDAVEFESRGRVDPSMVRALRREMRAAGANVVHVHGYKAAVSAALALPPTTRLFATHHGQGGYDRKVAIYVGLSLVAYRRAAHVFAVSDATRKHLISLGLPARLVSTQYNFLSLAEVGEVSAAPAGPTRVLYVGRLSHEKGVDVLLRAMAWTSDPSLQLEIVGDGPERARLEELADALGVSERASFVGFQTDIAKRMLAAHAVVLPSRTEGLPMTLVEAMAVGRPVIATAVGGVPEVFDNSLGGNLVLSDDPAGLAAALDAFSGDRDRRLALAAAGVQAVRERFSPARWAAETLQAYEAGLRA